MMIQMYGLRKANDNYPVLLEKCPYLSSLMSGFIYYIAGEENP